MTIIASLKVTNADRPRQLPVIVQRRNKLINALHDQLELARAEADLPLRPVETAWGFWEPWRCAWATSSGCARMTCIR